MRINDQWDKRKWENMDFWKPNEKNGNNQLCQMLLIGQVK